MHGLSHARSLALACLLFPATGLTSPALSQELEEDLLVRVNRYGSEATGQWYTDSIATATPARGPETLIAVASRLLDAARLTDALVFAHLAAQGYPPSVEAQFVHGEGHRLRGDRREIDPVYGLMLYRLAKRDGAEAAGRRFHEIRQLPGPDGIVFQLSPAALDIAVKSLLTDGLLDEALGLAELNSREYPESATAHEGLGDVLIALGDSASALDAFREAARWTSPMKKLTEIQAEASAETGVRKEYKLIQRVPNQ